MMAWVKKTTKVYRDGKLVNIIEENLTRSKYRKDLTKGLLVINSAAIKQS